MVERGGTRNVTTVTGVGKGSGQGNMSLPSGTNSVVVTAWSFCRLPLPHPNLNMLHSPTIALALSNNRMYKKENIHFPNWASSKRPPIHRAALLVPMVHAASQDHVDVQGPRWYLFCGPAAPRDCVDVHGLYCSQRPF